MRCWSRRDSRSWAERRCSGLASHPEAARLVDALGRQGIHVRAFADQPTWLRFGLPATRRIRRLATALTVIPTEAERRQTVCLQVPQKVWQTRWSAGGGSA